MNYSVPFSAASDPRSAGGKGFGLHRLASWGFRVPEGFVIPAEVYRSEVDAAGILPAPGDLARAGNDRISEVSAEARSALARLRFSPGLSEAIAATWESISRDGDAGITVACRSSATSEDSRAASFAGQYLTVLGLRSPGEIEEAIRKCWASLWDESAMIYAAMNGESPLDLAMAVVVQRVVPADVSGVVFSINPINGDRGEIYINSSWGLGEAVVSGLVTPDTYVVDKESLVVSSHQISQAKTVQFIIGEAGAASQSPVPPERVGAGTLDESSAREIASVARDAEAKAGEPMDIEWAIEGGELYVLQARPVTSI